MTMLSELVSKVRELPEVQQRQVLAFVESLRDIAAPGPPAAHPADDDPVFHRYCNSEEHDQLAQSGASLAARVWPAEDAK